MDRQPLIDSMGDSLLKSITKSVSNDELENAHALYSEWVVDGVDPEDNDYEFLLLNDLSEIQ
tara:strand:- start:954 stop:1139 length:186 start_codon:yes stop_codon:yes gene_type:complete